jgi:hypothetical protein
MADSILSSLLSGSTLKIVNDSSDSDDNLARNLKVSNVSIQYKSRAMRHMKEDGGTIVDSRIIDPITVTLSVFCASLDEVKVVNDILMDRKNTYTISSKGLVFPSMTAEELAIKQNGEMLTASPVQITMKELRKIGGETTSHRVVEQAPDSSNFARGIHTISATTSKVTDTFDKAIGAALPKLPNIPTGIPLP